jgi:hypothetical protein
MTHGFVKKLHELFRRKKEEIYERNAYPTPFVDRQLVEFNAWQNYLRSTLSLDVIDIEEGEKPGFFKQDGVPMVRIENPSNGIGYSREFIVVPYWAAFNCLAHDFIPDDLLKQSE